LNCEQNNLFACLYQPTVFGGAGSALLFFAELQRQEQRGDRDMTWNRLVCWSICSIIGVLSRQS
jgi:hypothetical protein